MLSRKGQADPVASLEEAGPQVAPRDRWDAALKAAFRETADAGSYVPRSATERALGQLESCLTDHHRPAGIDADPGMGKTVLLRVLAERLADRCRCVFLPYGSLSLTDLCAWALGRMGEARPSDPVQALTALARRLRDSDGPLVLLIDDASGLQLDVARELSALWSEAGGALQFVLSSPNDRQGARVFAAFGADLFTVRFADPMTLAETGDFVLTRMNQAGVPKVMQNRFDRERMEWLHAHSGGVPRLVQRLAESVLIDQPEGVRPIQHATEEWLGSPLDALSPVSSDL